MNRHRPPSIDATITATEASRAAWDVVVIGAGPAGSTAARRCALHDASVLLVDKAAFPRGKVCGCCVSRAALDMLERDGLGDVATRTDAPTLTAVDVHVARRRTTLALPGGAAISRERFDADLIRHAIDAGVRFLPRVNARVGDAAGDHRRLAVRADDTTHDIAARVVIVATGLSDASERDAATSTPVRNSRIGFSATAPADSRRTADYAAGVIHMMVDRGGYVGVVRLEDGRLDVAAACDPAFVRTHGGCAGAASRIIERAGGPPIDALADATWRGTPLLTRRPTRVAGERLLRVGDAAGYVEPFTGEGMAWAIASGAAVAPIACDAARRATWDARTEAAWASTHRRLLRGPQQRCRVIAGLLRRPRVTRALLAAFGLVPALGRRVTRSVATSASIDRRVAQDVA